MIFTQLINYSKFGMSIFIFDCPKFDYKIIDCIFFNFRILVNVIGFIFSNPIITAKEYKRVFFIWQKSANDYKTVLLLGVSFMKGINNTINVSNQFYQAIETSTDYFHSVDRVYLKFLLLTEQIYF